MKGHPLSHLICHEIKDTLFKVVDLDPNIYHVAGSVGKGRWAEIPWVSIFLKNLRLRRQEATILFTYLVQMEAVFMLVCIRGGHISRRSMEQK
nr:DUF3578 domain-containing protein [Bacillus haynesii]